MFLVLHIACFQVGGDGVGALAAALVAAGTRVL